MIQKNCCRTGRDGWTSKVLQEVLADLKTAELVYLGIPYLKNNKTGRTLLGQYCVKKFIVSWNPFPCTFRPSFLLCGCRTENNWQKKPGGRQTLPLRGTLHFHWIVLVQDGTSLFWNCNDIQKIIDKKARGEGRPCPCLASAVTLRNLWPGQALTLALHNCWKIGRVRIIVTILVCITA